MKRLPSTHFIFNCEVYPFDIIVSVNQTDDELKEWLPKTGLTKKDMKAVTKLGPSVTGKCVMYKDTRTVIRILQHEDSPIEFVIAHEIFHAAALIMDTVGIRLDEQTNSEAYAYLIGYITKEFYYNIN